MIILDIKDEKEVLFEGMFIKHEKMSVSSQDIKYALAHSCVGFYISDNAQKGSAEKIVRYYLSEQINSYSTKITKNQTLLEQAKNKKSIFESSPLHSIKQQLRDDEKMLAALQQAIKQIPE